MNQVKLFLIAVLVWVATAVSTFQPVAATVSQTAVDWRFGVVESYEDPAAASDLGVSWTRVKLHWAVTQQDGPGSWTPLVSDEQINGEISAGRMVVGLLIGIPDWARQGAGGLPRGLHLTHDDPRNTWANFVRQAVSRYDGRINHWIIWNEPDVGDANAPGHTWPGSVEDFFQLQRTAYLVAKETNPDVVIHLSAFTHFWDPDYIYRFLDVVVADPAAPDHNYYFDVLTAHLYFQPDSIYNLIQSFYGAVSSRNIPWKPLWLVETNAPPMDDPAWPVPNWTLKVTLYEQAAFVPQGLASALAGGAQRIALYKLKDTPTDRAANPEPFGLVRMNGSRRPAYTTYQVAIQYLAGAHTVQRERWDEVGQIRLDQDGHSTTVLFARLPAPQQATVRATADKAMLVDMWGEGHTISAQDGVFTIDLPPALCTQPIGDYCMIGGTTFYLVQAREGDAPPDGSAAADPHALDNTPDATAEPAKPPTTTPTSTIAPTGTLAATPTNPPATAVAQLPPTVAPVVEEAAVPPPPDAVGPAYWFLGAALLLALALGGWWWKKQRMEK